MSAVHIELQARKSDASFDDFVASRPHEESWELIDGHFDMEAQPTFNHQIIAGNLERLLNDALERSGAERIAVQNPTLDLSPASIDARHVPDVGVLGENRSFLLVMAAGSILGALIGGQLLGLVPSGLLLPLLSAILLVSAVKVWRHA